MFLSITILVDCGRGQHNFHVMLSTRHFVVVETDQHETVVIEFTRTGL